MKKNIETRKMYVVIVAAICFVAMIYGEHNRKLTDIKAQIRSLNTQNVMYRYDFEDKMTKMEQKIDSKQEETHSSIENINDVIDGLQKDIETEIERLDKEIDEVEIAKEEQKKQQQFIPSGYGVLTKSDGVNYYGDQKETWYNLPMEGVIAQAQNYGVYGDYWIREDGCKMYSTDGGDYIILACNRDVHPMGSIVQTSLGEGISLDSGAFAYVNPYQVDIAVAW